MEDKKVTVLDLEFFRSLHHVLVAQWSEALHGLREITDEDTGLAIGVVQIDLPVRTVEEVGDELAGNLWVLRYLYPDGIDCRVLQRSNLAYQIGCEMFSDSMYLRVVSLEHIYLVTTRHTLALKRRSGLSDP